MPFWIKSDGDDDDDDGKIQFILECFEGGETLMTSFMVKLMNQMTCFLQDRLSLRVRGWGFLADTTSMTTSYFHGKQKKNRAK